MKNTVLTLLAASVSFLLMSHPAEAHHGWLDFDSGREVTLEATVTDFHFTNPHCVVEFTAKDEKGQTVKWQGEFRKSRRIGTQELDRGFAAARRQDCDLRSSGEGQIAGNARHQNPHAGRSGRQDRRREVVTNLLSDTAKN